MSHTTKVAVLAMIGMYIFMVVYLGIKTLMEFDYEDFVGLLPKGIYDMSDYNYPTCVLIFLIILIMDPLMYISLFIHWLTHVGRKED